MTDQITIDTLSPEMRDALRKQFAQEQKEQEQKVKEGRKAYKDLVNETIPGLFNQLAAVSQALSIVKTSCFNDLQTLVKMKAEVYGKEEDQYSHSFTTDEGITLIIGHRISDNWDDTVTAGLTKVHKYLESLGKDKDSKLLVKSILQLLSRDAKGNMKSSRVLQLKKLADETGNAEFIDAIQIIQDAYRPTKSKEFVTARYKNNNGETIDLSLDITTADLLNESHEQTADKA